MQQVHFRRIFRDTNTIIHFRTEQKQSYDFRNCVTKVRTHIHRTQFTLLPTTVK